MSFQLSDKIRKLAPYEPNMEQFRIVMDANESYIPLPPEIMDIVSMAQRQVNINRYPDPMAKRLCGFFADYYGIDGRYVTAGNGSDELISVIMNTFLSKGSRVMTLQPDFSMYSFYTHLAELTHLPYRKNDDFTIDPDAVIKAVREQNCDMLIFSNPCNPTSLGLDRADVIKIITGVDALVVLDEAYMDFWDQSILQDAHTYDNLVMLRTCSKMGLAGLRIGFAVTNERFTKALQAAKSPYNVGAMTQAAAAAILAHPEYLRAACNSIIGSRNELYMALKEMEATNGLTVFETRTNFVTVRMDNSKEIWNRLKSDDILVRHFDGFLRITAAGREDNSAMMTSLLKHCKEVNQT